MVVSVPPSFIGWSDVYVADDESHFYQCVLYQSPGYAVVVVVVFVVDVVVVTTTVLLLSKSDGKISLE